MDDSNDSDKELTQQEIEDALEEELSPLREESAQQGWKMTWTIEKKGDS